MNPEVAVIIAIASFLADLVIIVAFVFQAKKSATRTAVAEGKHQQIIEQLRGDLDRCHEKIRNVESRLNTSDVSVGEMKADIRHILEAINRIESKLDGHISKEVEA